MSIDKSESEVQAKLIALVREALERDKALREKYEMSHRFRFVRDRLENLLEQLSAKNPVPQEVVAEATSLINENEVLAYVYLFNSQGAMLQSWVNMLTPKLFYEYSVNRPIYAERAHVENLLRTKANKIQHGYLTIVIQRKDLLVKPEANENAEPVMKIREGSLSFDRFVSLTHDGKDFELSEQGTLIPKI